MRCTVPCGSNAVGAKKWLEQDGSGAMKEFDGTGLAKGISLAAKDVEDNVAMIKIGYMKVGAKAASYNVGDRLELDGTGQLVTADVGGAIVGIAAETATIASDGDELLVFIHIAH